MSETPYSRMPRWRRRFELASVWFTLYSVFCFVAELELHPDEDVRSGWWYWNERLIGVVFTVDYLFRWSIAENRRRYPFTFMALVDLLSLAPFYVGLLGDPGNLETVRVLRVVRVLRLYRHSESMAMFVRAYRRCRTELLTVLTFVLLVILLNSLAMFVVEHPAQPDKVAKPSDAAWWCVVTMSTVGYGDITPITQFGRLVGVATVVVGVASYGVFLTLFGGAWIDVLKERRENLEKALERSQQEKGWGGQEGARFGGRIDT
jgi:voltage-gated potassium channel